MSSQTIPDPNRIDTSLLRSSIDRALDSLALALETLAETGDDADLAEVARAIGALQTAKREAEAIGQAAS